MNPIVYTIAGLSLSAVLVVLYIWFLCRLARDWPRHPHDKDPS